MSRKERHIVPNKDGGWDSKRENAERASKHFETKEDAMKWRREKSKEEGSELIPHRRMMVLPKIQIVRGMTQTRRMIKLKTRVWQRAVL